MYQLDRPLRERGVASHWTPYVQVGDIEDTLRRAALLGGTLLAGPMQVHGLAHVALLQDPAGARIGLWQPAPPPHPHG